MTTELVTLCPYCGELGDPHCALPGCSWMACPSCSSATGPVIGQWILVTWDAVTGHVVALPPPVHR